MATTDVLSGALALVQRCHCAGVDAKDARGVMVHATDPGAVCWIISGALLRVTGGPRPDRGVIYGAAVSEV